MLRYLPVIEKQAVMFNGFERVNFKQWGVTWHTLLRHRLSNGTSLIRALSIRDPDGRAELLR